MPLSKKTQENSREPRNNKKVAAIVFITLLVMTATAVIFGINTFSGGSVSTIDVELPLIITPLTDPATGEEYNVQTLFTVRFDKLARGDISNNELEEELSAIMLEMDMGKLLEKGRIEYLSSRSTELLKERLSDENIDVQVMVVDFATDDRVTLADPEDRSNKVMEGIFPNLK